MEPTVTEPLKKPHTEEIHDNVVYDHRDVFL